MKLKLLTLFSVLLVLGNSLKITQATARYVSKEGLSIPPYTSWETATDSIQECINICVFGDTIYVANGVYEEKVIMIPGLSLIGAGMDSCLIDSRGFPLTSPFYSVRVEDSCYFANFKIIVYDETHGFGIRVAGKNAIIELNNIPLGKLGIDVFSTGHNIVRNNIILNVNDGITCTFTSNLISENIIYPNDDGLNSNLNSSPTYINNTVILNNPQRSGSGYEGGFHILSILKNNSFYILQGEKGKYALGDSVINNVITGSPKYGMWTQSGGVIKNNIIKGADIGIDYIAGTPESVK